MVLPSGQTSLQCQHLICLGAVDREQKGSVVGKHGDPKTLTSVKIINDCAGEHTHMCIFNKDGANMTLALISKLPHWEMLKP